MASSFIINKADLVKILQQIKIAEDTSIGYTPGTAPKTILQSIMDAYGVTAANAAQLPAGLRTVDGTFNNLLPGRSTTGAADTLFPRLTNPVFLNDQDGDTMPLGPVGSGAPTITNTNYGVLPSGQLGSVADADPRIISNLIVDMSLNNPAAVQAFLNNPLAVARYKETHNGAEPFYTYSYTNSTGGSTFDPTAQQTLVYTTNLTNTDLQTIPNQSPDIGLSPGFNSWMTFFGQFFDHGLDLVTKGNNGTVYIPLQPDDPLFDRGLDGIAGTADDGPNFMALTRATATIVNGVPQHENTTTPWIDQNQTYTSHSSHQVFLREYVMTPTGAVSTGKLLDGAVAGTISNWGEIKAQALTMLGIRLDDFDVHNVPLLLTDQYGKFIPGANGYAQLVMAPDATHATNWLKEGTAAGITTEGSIGTNHAFLNDIAHSASPGFWDDDNNPLTPKVRQTADTNGVVGGPQAPGTYDDEMLNAHFVTGDGRGNENIALTAVHSIFHSEHNRVVDANKITILKSGDLAFLNEWLVTDVASLPVIPPGASDADIQAIANTLVWDGERLFQAARFSTEMQYQHLVFEEFARRIQPMVDPFVFNNSPEIDPAITAEFAHTVYRFGHSMLTGTVDRLDNNLNLLNGDQSQQTLLAVFLNPQAYLASGTDAATINANLIRGLTRDVGSAIDEMIVTDVRSNLLGLPLDLGALNIARGRDTGIPSLNETRRQLYNSSGLADLKPYTSWVDFAANIKNATAIINFIAAYGTHATITAQTTLAGKRAAAEAIVFGGAGSPADRLDFLNATGAYAGGTLGGLNTVDLWIGGLAEANPEFGGMLGTTFNYVFEAQMENLQNGDRMYYLSRTQGMNLLNQLEPNTFSDMVMRNTQLGDKYATHLNGFLFVTPDHILELDRGIAQQDYNPADLPGKDPDDIAGLDPIGASLFTPKVQRDYTGSTVVDGTHDFGGTLRFTGGEHVVIGGTEGNDIITSDKGIDTLWGDGGNDYLNAGTESDNVFGGEGDDIIEDPFGDDLLRGNQGNDVITSARGADILFGDQGSDYIVVGQDASEVFGGTDNDFILGGNGGDLLLGNEGDDWIEGAGGFDTLAGDNSELFFNSPIIGHDVLFGQGDEVDYDAESGDDIMGSGSSVFRYEGMFGFDWGIAKYDNSAIRFDLNLNLVVTGVANDILRDRFDNVEALSGWQNNDELFGDNRGHVFGTAPAPLAFDPTVFADPLFFNTGVNGEVTVDNLLNNAGVDRITGFRAWFGGAATTLGTVAGTAPTDTFFRDGNILMGGDGSDTIMGRGGFDIIDGDAWLNVRIKIVIPSGPNAGTYSAESMNTDTTVMGPYAGKVFNTNPDGSPNFSSPAFGGRSLTSLMLDRTINPGQLSIVREVLYDNTNLTGPNKSIDTAVYQGNFAEYQIEGVNETGQATDLNGDGFIYVRDLDNGATRPPVVNPVTGAAVRVFDDTDLIKNIERLQFADRIFRLDTTPPSDIQWNGVTPTNALPGAGATIANLSTTDDDTTTGFVYLLAAGSSAGFAVSAAGVVTTTAALVAGTTYTLNIRSTDTTGGARTETFIIRTGTGAIDAITATSTDTIVYGQGGNDTLNGGTGNDNLFGQAGNDNLNGGAGNDILVGGAGTDNVNGGAGNDTIRHAVGDGGGLVDGGADSDTLQITGDATDQDLAVNLGASITLDGVTVTNVESVRVDLGAGIDTLVYTAPGGATVNLGTGTASGGITAIVNVENVTGGVGNDTITGDGNANVLNGGGGNDTLNGGAGDDTLTGGAGNDTLNGDAGIDTVLESGNVNFTLTNTTLSGNGADTLSGIEQVTLTGGALANTLDASAFTVGTVTLDGAAGNDTLTGGTGNDTLIGGAGNDTLNGGAGTDTVVESGNVNFTLTNTSLVGNGTDTLSSIEQVLLTGGGAANTLNASAFTAGVVTLDGAGGNDTLTGGTGNDTLIGGTGNDTLTGGAGNDTLIGGAGTDTFGFALGFGTDLITDFDANAAGGQDLLNVSAYTGANDITAANFASRVTISLGNGGTTVTIGTDTITLLGVTGVGQNVITVADFILN